LEKNNDLKEKFFKKIKAIKFKELRIIKKKKRKNRILLNK